MVAESRFNSGISHCFARPMIAGKDVLLKSRGSILSQAQSRRHLVQSALPARSCRNVAGDPLSCGIEGSGRGTMPFKQACDASQLLSSAWSDGSSDCWFVCNNNRRSRKSLAVLETIHWSSMTHAVGCLSSQGAYKSVHCCTMASHSHSICRQLSTNQCTFCARPGSCSVAVKSLAAEKCSNVGNTPKDTVHRNVLSVAASLSACRLTWLDIACSS